LEVAELVGIAARLARIELADDLSEQTREAPTLDSDVDQRLLHLLIAFGLLSHQALLWLRLVCFSALRLLLNPFSDLRLGEPPCPTNLERGDLLGRGQPVDRPLRDLQELCDLLEGEDLALAGTCRHGDGQSR